MKTVRLGIVGLGKMGRVHAQNVLAGQVEGLQLTAGCDAHLSASGLGLGTTALFTRAEDMFTSGKVDAVLIATPHYSHTALGIAALQAGLHVLVEKPISVHKADAERLIAAHTRTSQVFAAMFNQRTDPFYATIRRMVQDGELGTLRRISWAITNWFRPQCYYQSDGWRATWEGEGGGVLLNQCPHNLDLLSWMFGQPQRVRAFCSFGRYHDIEVEDDVTAYLEYDSGLTATFITSTGEAPGTNRLEIVAERGRLVMEDDTLRFRQNDVPMSEFSRTTTEPFSLPKFTDHVIEVRGHGDQHLGVLQNFADAILNGAPLLAPAAEGLLSVELANAMLLSTFQNRTIELPLDAAFYERELQATIAESRTKIRG